MVKAFRASSWLLGIVLLAGCVPATEEPVAAPAARPPAQAPAGLQSVMGATAAALTARFGRPDLDIVEGRARKLQYSSPACVLDAYLYPSGSGREPVVTHVDARLPDGRDMDRASCVAALNAARQSR